MKAALIRKYGKPEQLKMETVAEPQAKANELKIKVLASSVNPVDWKVRSGSVFFLSGFRFPKILGGDFSGEVVACGSEVTDFVPGDKVYGLSEAMFKAGAYAEYLVSKPSKLALKPNVLSYEEAACIPLAGQTAYQALLLGKLEAGQKVLITGCTGGVGHFAVQIAKAMGAHVTGVCHSRNADLAYQLGCDKVLPYDAVDFRNQAERYALIFDAAAKYGYWSSAKCLEKQGRYVSTLPTPLLFLKQFLSKYSQGKRAYFVGVSSKRAHLEKLALWCNEGKIKPFIEHIFSLEQIAEAHTLSETEKVRGKIAIRIEEAG